MATKGSKHSALYLENTTLVASTSSKHTWVVILMFSHNSSGGLTPPSKAPNLILTHTCDKVKRGRQPPACVSKWGACLNILCACALFIWISTWCSTFFWHTSYILSMRHLCWRRCLWYNSYLKCSCEWFSTVFSDATCQSMGDGFSVQVCKLPAHWIESHLLCFSTFDVWNFSVLIVALLFTQCILTICA